MARLMSRFCEDLSPPKQKQVHQFSASDEISAVSGSNMNAHFGNSFTNRLAVAEVPVFGGPDTMSNSSAPDLVFQTSEPSIKLVGAQESVHVSYCIQVDTCAQQCGVGLFKNCYGQFAADGWKIIQKDFQ